MSAAPAGRTGRGAGRGGVLGGVVGVLGGAVGVLAAGAAAGLAVERYAIGRIRSPAGAAPRPAPPVPDRVGTVRTGDGVVLHVEEDGPWTHRSPRCSCTATA